MDSLWFMILNPLKNGSKQVWSERSQANSSNIFCWSHGPIHFEIEPYMIHWFCVSICISHQSPSRLIYSRSRWHLLCPFALGGSRLSVFVWVSALSIGGISSVHPLSKVRVRLSSSESLWYIYIHTHASVNTYVTLII